jgi:hypothetical protein
MLSCRRRGLPVRWLALVAILVSCGAVFGFCAVDRLEPPDRQVKPKPTLSEWLACEDDGGFEDCGPEPKDL